MDGIGDNNNLGYVVEICSLVDATPDSKEFCFSACDMNCMMDRLCYRFVIYVYMCNRSCDIVLDAYIRCYDCCGNHLSQWQMIAQASKSQSGYNIGSSQENSTRSLC